MERHRFIDLLSEFGVMSINWIDPFASIASLLDLFAAGVVQGSQDSDFQATGAEYWG